MGMLYKIRIRGIQGSRINYLDFKSKPILQLKIKWKDNSFSWENQSKIATTSLQKFEDNIWRSTKKKRSFIKISFLIKNNLTFISYTSDNYQRNNLHFSPLHNCIKLTSMNTLFTKRLASLDFEGRNPLIICLIYNLPYLFTYFLSNSNLESLNRLYIWMKIFKSKSTNNFKENNNQTQQNDLIYIKCLKLLFLWLFFITIKKILLVYTTKLIDNTVILLLLSNSNFYQWLSYSLISESTLLSFAFQIESVFYNQYDSKRLNLEKLLYLLPNRFRNHTNNSNTIHKEWVECTDKYYKNQKSLKKRLLISKTRFITACNIQISL